MRDLSQRSLTSLQQAFDGKLLDRSDDRPACESEFGGQRASGWQRSARREPTGAYRGSERGLQGVLPAEPR